MYRFYAELAGASVREIEYRRGLDFPLEELLGAIRPSTRAVLIANPNNPTGTGTDLGGVEAHSRRRAERRRADRRSVLRILRRDGAAAWIREYPNLFVSRTFSKVYGMAAMRCGCLFSQRGERPVAAQSAVAVQREHAGRDGGARRGSGSRVCRELRRRSAGGARTACAGFDKLGIRLLSEPGEFRVCSRPASARFRFAMRCASAACWFATAATRFPAAFASPSARARRSRDFWTELGEVSVDPLIVFDMDGVLAEVTESYREAIVQTVEHFTGQRVTRDLIQEYKNQGGWNNDWALSQQHRRGSGRRGRLRRRGRCTSTRFFSANNGDGLILRESWFPQPGLLERLAGSVTAWRSSPAACAMKPTSRCERFAAGSALRSDHLRGRCREPASPRRKDCSRFNADNPGRKSGIRRRHGG